MNAIQVTVWLEQPKYEALKHCLGSTAEVEKAAQARLDQLYEQTVPLEEREKISERIAQMRQEEVRREAAARRVMGYRIMEEGQEICFETEHGYDVLQLAQRLRNFQRGSLHTLDGSFCSTFWQLTKLDHGEYATLSKRFFRGDEQVQAVFDIDIDGGKLAILDRDSGRREYAISDISAAAFHAFRKAYIPDWRRSEIFWSKLEGKELTPKQVSTDTPTMDDNPRLEM